MDSDSIQFVRAGAIGPRMERAVATRKQIQATQIRTADASWKPKGSAWPPSPQPEVGPPRAENVAAWALRGRARAPAASARAGPPRRAGAAPSAAAAPWRPA